MAVVVDRDLAGLQQAVDLLHPVAPPVPPRPAGVREAGVALDDHGVVALQVLAGDVLEQRPPGVPVHAVPDRAPGDPAVEDLHELEGPPVPIRAGVEEVGAGPVAGRGGHLRRVPGERPAEDVELPGQRVGAAAERGREVGVHQRALGQGDVDEVVEAVVEQDLGVEHHDHVDPDEHLEHAFVQVEVDRAGRLGVGAGPVEPGVLALAPYRELHPERAVADAVVVDPILEGLRLGRQVLHDEGAHGAVGALEQRLAGAAVGPGPEAFADLDDPLLAGAAAGDDGHEVAVVHLRGAGVVHQDGEGGFVGLAP